MPVRVSALQGGLAALGLIVGLLVTMMNRHLRPGARPRSSLPPAELLTPVGQRYRRVTLAGLALMVAVAALTIGLIVTGRAV